MLKPKPNVDLNLRGIVKRIGVFVVKYGISVPIKHRTKKRDKIDPNRPFYSRVIDFSDFCDIVKEQFEEIRSLGGAEEMERYNVEFDELTKLFERN